MKKSLLAGLLLFAVPLGAQDKVQELERRLDILGQEIERLKLGEASDPAPASRRGFSPAASKVYAARTKRISVGGYGEMAIQDYAKKRQNADAPGMRDEADFLRGVLYVGFKYNDRILFNSEIEFEHATSRTGVAGAAPRGEVSLEQAYLDFDIAPFLGVRAGLLLVPVGIVNEMHEPTTFHGVRRPSVEQNLIPTTWRENGAGFFGEIGPVSYRTYVLAGLQAAANANVAGFGAASALRNGRSSGAKSFAEDAAWVGRVDITPVSGVRAGASAYIGEADHNFTAPAIPVTLWDFHGAAEWRGAEFRALYAQGAVGNADALNAAQGIAAASGNSVGREFFGGYAELAFDVLSLCSASSHYLAPYFRYERYDTQADTPAGWAKNPANSRIEYTLGVTYKPIPQVAVKLDQQWMLNQARTGVNQLNLGLAYIF